MSVLLYNIADHSLATST